MANTAHRIALLLLLATSPVPCLAREQTGPPVWNAERTRLVVISLAGFQGEKKGHTSFSTSDRLDDPLVALFRGRGVPDKNILYLKDNEATTARVKDQFLAFLLKSTADENLIFYYSSHGGYNPETGAHTYTTFDGSIPIGWFFGTIEGAFRGSRAMLFSDCCYSGGMVELTGVRPVKRTAFGALSTTGSHNVGYSGWRFTDVLIRAWGGDVAMDADDSGTIDFGELCRFARRYMAFVAEGKPLSTTTGSFETDLVLSETDHPTKEGIGSLIEAQDDGKWFKAEVVDLETNNEGDTERVRVHFTDKNRYAKYLWLRKDQTREYAYPRYKVGADVEIRNSNGEWVPGRVLDSFAAMHECHYEGKSASYDEWMSPGRIRKASE
jgi:hypothetical protein